MLEFVITIVSMNYRQQKFVNEYCIDLNATQAAIRAGYSEANPSEIGYQLLQKPSVLEAIAERQADIAAAAGVTAEAVLRKWWEIATADHNELAQVRRVNCRHCYGVGNGYQWTQIEYSDAVAVAVRDGKPAPDGMGGFGFDPNGEPHPDCTECGGDGVEVVRVADTRKLKGAARRLYAGVKMTNAGPQVLTNDQGAALVNLARCMGMFKDNINLAGALDIKPLSDFYAKPATDIEPVPSGILADSGT